MISLRIVALLLVATSAAAGPAIMAPRIDVPPALDDFLAMAPSARVGDQVAKVTGFKQREPNDGSDASEETDVYVAYDRDNLYAIFVCFDREAARIRGHLTRRENLTDEDTVALYLDTFRDQQRAYTFASNPAGVQQDAIWTENGGLDTTFDTVWESRGARTPQGFVVWMAIPFKSLRFPPERNWGVLFERTIVRKQEDTYWPPVSASKQGRLTQEASLDGVKGVERGHNMQFTPYTVARAFRDIDRNAPAGPRFRDSPLGARVGVDSKFVIKNALVVDTTINPDFSQVESDEPQVTVNQRFEVYFPEKRPFFLENADYFQTSFSDNSIDFFHLASPLLFTRRIQDPRLGVRVTGKLSATSIGLLLADDRSPGESIAPASPFFGKRAMFAVGRVARDFGAARIGAIVTRRDFAGQTNQVIGLDGRVPFRQNWVAMVRTAASSDSPGGKRTSGYTVDAEIVRDDRNLHYDLAYFEASPGYVQRAGFYRRPDQRRIMQLAQYRFRSQGRRVDWWGPMTYYHVSRDFSGRQIDRNIGVELDMKLRGSTFFDLYTGRTDDTLRPSDYSQLRARRTYVEYWTGGDIQTQFSKSFGLSAGGFRQTSINYNPPAGVAPFLGEQTYAKIVLRVRPSTALSIDQSYILNRLEEVAGGSIFTNQILQTKWNYQFTRNLSARVIARYASVLANPLATSLGTTRGFNGDFLITYMRSPGTAFYIGYNGDLQNFDPALRLDPAGEILRTPRGMLNDSRQVFAKISYQIRL